MNAPAPPLALGGGGIDAVNMGSARASPLALVDAIGTAFIVKMGDAVSVTIGAAVGGEVDADAEVCGGGSSRRRCDAAPFGAATVVAAARVA